MINVFLVVLPLLFHSLRAQSICENFGTVNGATCACPPGVGGPTCSLPACGGNLFQGAQRPVAPVAPGAIYANLTGCPCEAGFEGTGCNVCQTDVACQRAFSQSSGSQAPDPVASITPGQTQNTTITCSRSVRVWAAGQMSCKVINPTLQALFPRQSTLNIQRSLKTSLSPYPGVSATGADGSIIAQLWYDGVEQFYCQATTCQQSITPDNSTVWNCNDLKCNCRKGATFCGGVPASDITQTIDTLEGTLEINCAAPSPGATTANCLFKQDLLQKLFGRDGLALSDCSFGECVRQSVIDATISGPQTYTSGSDAAPGLDPGVIGGLAVVGAFLLAAIILLVWGWFSQRKARAQPNIPHTSGGIGVQWSNVGYSVPNAAGPWWKFAGTPASGHKVILNGITGRVEPGRMLAILGPSGAGKTTLVELLGGKQKSGRTTGSATYFSADSQDQSIKEKKPRIGFVDQADVLPPNLTVREALLVAARLRLPESVPDADKVSRVFEVMAQLGITDIADTRIGSHERRGISGGEMRRVSIGMELIARPAILMCDEPTSGLDSVSAAKVVSVLAALAHNPENPTAIIASIHQPSSRLYHMFDQILLLASGREIYSGRGGLVPAEYFAARGLPCPDGYNIADHLLDIASQPPNSVLQEQRDRHSSTETASNGVILEKAGTEGAVPLSALATSPWASTAFHSNYATTFLTQLQVLSGREWKNLKRDHSLFIAHFSIASVLGVFCGGLYYQTGITIAGFQSRIGSLFFLGSLLSFTALSALYNLVEIRPLFLRERSGLYYSPTAWLLSRFLFDVIPLRLIPTIVVSSVTYWMTGLAPYPVNFFKFLLILVLFALAMTLFNFLLACVFRNGGIAILLSALFNLFIMTYAGFFVHLNDIPPVLRWLQYFSILKYCLEALSVNEVGSGLMIVDVLSGVPVNVSAQLIMELLFGFGANNYYRDVLVLFAFIAGFAIALIAVVLFFVRERR